MAIAVGSNLGDRRAFITFAVSRLEAVLDKLRVSPLHETDPVGVGAQPRFLNGAIIGTTSLEPRALLERLLAIEREAGRIRPFEGAPRTLDLDLIFYADRVIHEPGLQVPHPRFRDRLFVLEPLEEVAGDWIDPVTGLSVAELRRRLAQHRPGT